MRPEPPQGVERREIEVGGTTISLLVAGEEPGTTEGSASPVLLLHGTFWSRVWEPVLAGIAATGRAAYALDFPGFGRSSGRLGPEAATVPALAAWTRRAADTLGLTGPLTVAGHDIGGAVAQHLAAHDPAVERLVLMNSVLYDSWPVPAVARFRDPDVAASITVGELLEARGQSLDRAVARPLTPAERAAWLEPWRHEDRVRSWIALAAAADARFTLELVGPLARRALPTLLIWGEDDQFQPIHFAERYAAEMPDTELVRVPGARHIPTVEAPGAVTAALTGFLADHPV